MKSVRPLAVSAAFLLVAVAAAAWLYPRLPARVPSHWDALGRVDGYLPRAWAVVLPALIVLVAAALGRVLPAISPRRFEIGPFAPVFDMLLLLIQGVLLVIGVSTLLIGAGYPLPMPTIALVSVGVLFMVLGNYMGKLRRNFFIGIRSPWTLASAAVWERTHRLGGWLFIVGGLVAVVAAFCGLPPWLPIACLVAAGLVPWFYSLLVYRRLDASR